MENPLSDAFSVQKRVRNIRGLAVRHLDVIGVGLQGDSLKIGFTLSLLVNDALPQVFFTSDLIENSANPTWEEIDFATAIVESADLNSHHCVLNLFALVDEHPVKCLLRWTVDLRALIRVGNHLNEIELDFKINTVVFLLKSGIYLCTQDIPSSITQLKSDPPRAVRKPYSPAALRQLIKLEKDLAQVRERRKSARLAISERTTGWANRSAVLRQMEVIQQRLQNFRSNLQDLQQSNLALEQSNRDLVFRNCSLSTGLRSNRVDLEATHEDANGSLDAIMAGREILREKKSDLRNRQRELVSSIKLVYPINRSPSGRIFVAGIWLPSVDQYANCDDMTLSASLGYAVHLSLLLSKILNVPLRFPLKFFCSMSSIADHISAKLLDREREFPLHIKARERTRFYYGVFLLNLDIAQLRLHFGLGTADLKKTLENIETLMEEKWASSRRAISLSVPSGVEEPVGGFSPMPNLFPGSAVPQANGAATLVTVQSTPDFRRRKNHLSSTSAVFIPNGSDSSNSKK